MVCYTWWRLVVIAIMIIIGISAVIAMESAGWLVKSFGMVLFAVLVFVTDC